MQGVSTLRDRGARERIHVVWVAALTFAYPAIAPCQDGLAPEILSPASPAVQISGDLSASYSYQVSGSADGRLPDHDMVQRLALVATTPRSNRLEFHFLGALEEDLDGGSAITGFFPY